MSAASGQTIGGFSFTRDHSAVAYTLGDAKTFPEVYVTRGMNIGAGRKLTNLGNQIQGWKVGNREMIAWKSTDGTEITGVLHKPADFQAGRKYPLLVIIHGGPTAISRPFRVAGAGPYPMEQWLGRGAVILEPNYRGSAGFGEKFRSLNVRNLGIGDAWDVLSGVDYLVAQGIVDQDRMGVMGWSQGGYISAFLATHKRQPFKAISVGAGISNWMTYYVNTDIHQFTRQLPRRNAVGRPGHLCQDVAHDHHQAGENTDADPARRVRYESADAERVRAVSGTAGRGRARETDHLQGLQPRAEQAEGGAGGDGAQLGVVQPIRVGRKAESRTTAGSR